MLIVHKYQHDLPPHNPTIPPQNMFGANPVNIVFCRTLQLLNRFSLLFCQHSHWGLEVGDFGPDLESRSPERSLNLVIKRINAKQFTQNLLQYIACRSPGQHFQA